MEFPHLLLLHVDHFDEAGVITGEKLHGASMDSMGFYEEIRELVGG
jgi:hypothetical protein